MEIRFLNCAHILQVSIENCYHNNISCNFIKVFQLFNSKTETFIYKNNIYESTVVRLILIILWTNEMGDFCCKYLDSTWTINKPQLNGLKPPPGLLNICILQIFSVYVLIVLQRTEHIWRQKNFKKFNQP